MFLKYNRGFDKLYNIIRSKPRDFKTEVIFIYGPSGSGKSRYAWETWPNAYPKDGSIWWDGYQNQDTVIIDDFKFDPKQREDYLKLFDRYPYQVQYKGGYIAFNSRRIVITSSQDLEHAIHEDPETNAYREFFRRIETIKHMTLEK